MHVYQGFFSYAHSDAAADPDLVEAFTRQLELRVSNKFTNAKFAIWRDTENIRIGERWNAKIESAINSSDIMILLLSPKWVESDYCRKEYLPFKAVELNKSVGEYVAPLLVREIAGQKKHFTEEQNETVLEIEQRQYVETLAASFVDLTKDQRTSLVEQIADDIAGMVERMRDLPAGTRNDQGRSRGRPALQKNSLLKLEILKRSILSTDQRSRYMN
ncbi:toll/interleukin-1 receptor domain-containing protein [Mesorhizobium sp. C277A]|uniref:toll/interleukin-1 receptor domain-containing protein n=1 Tax=Mesorhizobium sp. C277A TaxID=2956827 RepID=UPI0003CF98D6|nr:toll/interleukin-1 receptor domain-containing protein [Mesorhizobium sp. LSJC277A00]ESW73472.1 hypothetical protein X771_01545 [Mesorhizobium sp. LSJC277A00]